MKVAKAFFGLFTALSLFLCTRETWSATLHVPADHATIQEAIDVASNGDEIIVAPGTYIEFIDFHGKAIRLKSSDGPDVTIIEGTGRDDGVVQCINGEDANTVLDGFAITGGNGMPYGGGMRNENSSPTIRNCVFKKNTSASAGGGMYNLNSNPKISNCIFIDNSGSDGGGIYNQNSAPCITQCEFSENHVTNDGGAVVNDASSSVISNCIFVGNTSVDDGGALRNFRNANSLLVNCLFYMNMADRHGGGIVNEESDTTIINCTFTENRARVNGGGMNLGFQAAGEKSPTVANSIFWMNTDNNGANIDESAQIHITRGTPTVSYCDIQGGWSGGGIGNINIDPEFVDAANGNFRLAPNSPCIEVGDVVALPEDACDLDNDGSTPEPIPLDLNAEPRTCGSTVDMGAYEYCGTRVKSASRENIPSKEPSASNLVLVTHGFAVDADGWVQDVANEIARSLSVRGLEALWDIWTYDWKDGAALPNSIEAAQNGKNEGLGLGLALRDMGYDHVHFISHSAGVWLVDEASKQMGALAERETTIHLTLLDAYVPDLFDESDLGSNGDWTEQYFHDGTLPNTQVHLTNAYNVDITLLNLFVNGPVDTHSWPHEWYLDTVRYPLDTFFQSWGFSKSKEFSGNLPSHGDYVRGQTQTLTPVRVGQIQLANGDFSAGDVTGWIIDGPGSVIVVESPPGNYVVKLVSLSPIAIGQLVDTPNSGFVVSLSYRFGTPDGVLAISIGDVEIGRLTAPEELNEDLADRGFLVVNPELQAKPDVLLTVSLNGPTGSSVSIDNIVITAFYYDAEFVRGDANADQSVDIADVLTILGELFLGKAEVSCEDAMDVNDDGNLDISDPVSLLLHLFVADIDVPSPGTQSCGVDPSEDRLTCIDRQMCE